MKIKASSIYWTSLLSCLITEISGFSFVRQGQVPDNHQTRLRSYLEQLNCPFDGAKAPDSNGVKVKPNQKYETCWDQSNVDIWAQYEAKLPNGKEVDALRTKPNEAYESLWDLADLNVHTDQQGEEEGKAP